MKYQIQSPLLASTTTLGISKTLFESIRSSQQCLVNALLIEEKFEYLIQNYADFERELLVLALDHSLFNCKDTTEFNTKNYVLERRVINLLTTTQLYHDQVGQLTKKISNSINQEYKQQVAGEAGSYSSYRIVKALRNHVQHRGLPINEITIDFSAIGTGLATRRRVRAIPKITDDEWSTDPRNSCDGLSDLHNLGGKADLRRLVREYIASQFRIHAWVRNRIGVDCQQSEEVFRNARSMFVAGLSKEEPVDVLEAVKLNSELEVDDTVIISEHLVHYRELLKHKNRDFSNITRSYVTNE